jgi:hypothetical protein
MWRSDDDLTHDSRSGRHVPLKQPHAEPGRARVPLVPIAALPEAPALSRCGPRVEPEPGERGTVTVLARVAHDSADYRILMNVIKMVCEII